MMGQGNLEAGASPTPAQHLKEYDPEWAQAWVTDTANAGCDHATLLAQGIKVPTLLTHHFHMTDPDTGQLMGAMTDIQAAQARRLLESTGQPVTYTPLDAPHTMHEPMAQWSATSSRSGSRLCPRARRPRAALPAIRRRRRPVASPCRPRPMRARSRPRFSSDSRQPPASSVSPPGRRAAPGTTTPQRACCCKR
jgi:hypothetical protein